MNKKITYLLLSTSLLFTLYGCSNKGSKDLTSTKHTAISTVDINDVYLKNIENSSKIEKSAKLLDALNQNENIMISITSLNMALGMVLNGSIGDTKAGIEKFIGMSTEESNSYHRELLDAAKEDDVLNITNSIWIKDAGYKLNEEYNNNIFKTYDTVSKVIKFDDNGKEEINKFVAKNTNKMIPSLLDSIKPDATSYIINTVLFDGKWKIPFEDSQVRDQTFTCRDDVKETVKMMMNSETYYMDNKHASGFKKSYTDYNYSFIGILPKTEGDIVVSDLDIGSLLDSQTNEYDLTIGIPEFNFSSSVNLSDVLMRTTLSNMFDESNEDIINIIKKDNASVPLYISNVIQKTRIENTQDGTKAAAATSLEAIVVSRSIEEKQKKEVVLNRPFVFVIMDETTQEPLFMGIVQNPNL